MIAIIQARVSSKRLPGKVLKKLNNLTILERVINQVKGSFSKKNIIVATSLDKKDIAICKICRKNKIKYYRGDLNNVAKRYFEVLKKTKKDSFLRVCADSPFIDPVLINKCKKIFYKKNPDFLTNVLPRSFPKGQSIEIFNSDFYISNFYKIKKKKDTEHVTTYFYFNKKKYNFINLKNNYDLSKKNMCIDYPKDLIKAERIIDKSKKNKLFKNWKKYIKKFK